MPIKEPSVTNALLRVEKVEGEAPSLFELIERPGASCIWVCELLGYDTVGLAEWSASVERTLEEAAVILEAYPDTSRCLFISLRFHEGIPANRIATIPAEIVKCAQRCEASIELSCEGD